MIPDRLNPNVCINFPAICEASYPATAVYGLVTTNISVPNLPARFRCQTCVGGQRWIWPYGQGRHQTVQPRLWVAIRFRNYGHDKDRQAGTGAMCWWWQLVSLPQWQQRVNHEDTATDPGRWLHSERHLFHCWPATSRELQSAFLVRGLVHARLRVCWLFLRHRRTRGNGSANSKGIKAPATHTWFEFELDVSERLK